jgi:hypothetical protein
MADKQLSLKQDADDNLFADDDPLAALARIASFEPQGETRPKPSIIRREPEFNLEDELLKEFEQYEEPAAPAVVPEIHAEQVIASKPGLFDKEPAFDEPGLEDDGAYDSQTVFGDEAPAAEPILTVEPEAPVRSPIAELRAVPQPSFVGPTEPIRPVSHPVFDLEDEILKEFAAFDARRAPPAAARAPASQVQAPVQAPVVEPEWKPAFAPVVAAHARVEPDLAGGRREEDQRYRAYRDAFVEEAAAPQPVAAVPTVEPVVAAEPAFDLPALDAMEAEVDPDRWHETKLPIFAREAARDHSPSAEESAEEPALFEVEPAAGERWDDEIATEASASVDIAAEPQPMLDIDAEPAPFDAPDEFAAAVEPIVPAVAPVLAPTAPIVENKVVPRSERQPMMEAIRQPAKQADIDLDQLLADVERFPVPPAPVAKVAPPLQVQEIVPALPVEKPVVQAEAASQKDAGQAAAAPVASQAERPAVELTANIARTASPVETGVARAEIAETKPAVSQPSAAIATPLATDVEKPVAAPRVEPVVNAAESAASVVPPVKMADPAVKSVEPAAKATASHHVDADGHEIFDEAAFELDLTEIELDMLEMEVASSVAPALHEDHVTASEAALADIANASVAAKQPVSAERRFEPQPKPVEDYSSLPFDPSQISSEEDPVQAISEMDVPETPVVDHDEEPMPPEPDYDIDIDAEMAHIFSQPNQRPAAVTPAKASQPAQPLSATDLDEFERALEEDFRRSLSENRATSTPDRVALTPAAYETGRREGSTGRRILVLAASVAGLVLIGGAGVYAYWGNSGRLLASSGEPKIILADKDPVKVEPKERGGQIVPNQDKAVYDRVSGEAKELTKQDRLVTSNEEPVDVVQKTLMPEALPQDDDQASATDTNDTTDPRLLPPDQQDKNVSTDEANDSVSPRKVRTMVVRSDGTLMPRDEEPVVAKQKTPAEQSQDRSLDVTPASTEDVPERLTANDDIAKQIKQATDDKSFVPEAKQPADAMDMSAKDTDAKTPVMHDQPTATDTAKTADQPTQQQATATDQSATSTDQVSTATDQPKTTTDQAASTATDQATSTTSDPAATATDQQASDTTLDAKPDTVPVKTQDLAAATPTDDTADKTADTANTATDTKPADTSTATDTATDKTADQPAAATDNTQSDDAVKPAKVKTATLANTPIPANRPVDQPVDIVGRVTDQGNVKNQEVASADPTNNQPAETATPAGAYVIQIASLPSEAEAQKSFTKLSARFASVIGGHSVDIRKAAIKNKGTYYRVRVIAGTRQEATDLCSRYKAAGGSCLVSK